MRNISELRQDLVTGSWVLIATGRARRPHVFGKKNGVAAGKTECPFEALGENAIFVIDKTGEGYRTPKKNFPYLQKHWWAEVVPNKYPAVGTGVCRVLRKSGPHKWMDGVGFHEVIVTRDHTRSIALMKPKEVEYLVKTYRERYAALKDEECIKYIAIFHNHGKSAGASIFHPHSQLMAIPVIPPDVQRSLIGSMEYAHRHEGKCVHCVMLAFERKEKKRIVYENKDFVVLCPYVSRAAFEIRIFPKRHNPNFEISQDHDLPAVADALRITLKKLARGLKNPDYNFFVHTAPTLHTEEYDHYHWHIEILPKTGTWAGFEISTGIDIATVSPEDAARLLRGVRV